MIHKLPKSRTLEFIWPIHQKGHVSVDWLVREYDIWEKQGVNRVESIEVPNPRAGSPEV
jgi:hypothetical protein